MSNMEEPTKMAEKIISITSQKDFIDRIGITYHTLYKRLSGEKEWKKSEVMAIESMYNQIMNIINGSKKNK